MASKTTLNAKNLEALGAKRLAELLIEISTGNANHKRLLRMELVGNSSGAELAREVRKRLGSIGRSKSWIDWQNAKSVRADLEAQRKSIAEKIAPTDPNEAFELIWQFLSLADPIFERSCDGSGALIEASMPRAKMLVALLQWQKSPLTAWSRKSSRSCRTMDMVNMMR